MIVDISSRPLTQIILNIVVIPNLGLQTSIISASLQSFLGLNIVEFVDGEIEAYVTFEAHLSSGVMRERSRFLRVDCRWLYESGDMQ